MFDFGLMCMFVVKLTLILGKTVPTECSNAAYLAVIAFDATCLFPLCPKVRSEENEGI
jgi:hypothetical protein